FGYYIEVTKSNLGLVPEDYQRKQTLVNAERFITNELKEYEDAIIGATERLTQLEYHLFDQVRLEIAAMSGRIQATAAAVALTDVLYSLAEAAVTGQYTRPVINDEGRIHIVEGRHPVLENVLEQGRFVPNDTVMDRSGQRLMLITGPNMAGKSTYMRQVALIVLMAQMGSFVPATAAESCLVDRIFTRIGAADDLAGGQSTFMMEMNECREIVSGATGNSLIIMDEVGRGTSTYDGISIARALVEYIHQRIGAKTLFSTHYHELTDLEALPGIVNYNVIVDEQGDEVIFLRRVAPGKANRSYGIHVAGLAGLPDEIINRANEVLNGLEKTKVSAAAFAESITSDPVGAGSRELVIAEQAENSYKAEEHPVLQELRDLDIMRLTPMEAIIELDRLKKKIS
ncbi:MAG: DNA mismatch repair protein MutS, partial [Peptococcaceae bacterium]|nr:DNA mismatch repair protein MutS [Peptococcaceae bacterium]